MTEGLQVFFGGTFDPVHYGHLSIATALANTLSLQRITLLPNHQSPHRPPPIANAEQRLTMLELATSGQPLFSIDARELARPAPSFTITTLKALRDKLGPHIPLAFVIGQDALQTLHRWHHWQQLLDYSHFLICTRPGYLFTQLAPALQSWLKTHQIEQPQQLHQSVHGKIYLLTSTQVSISATLVRQRLQARLPCDQLLPLLVSFYIRQHNLYR